LFCTVKFLDVEVCIFVGGHPVATGFAYSMHMPSLLVKLIINKQ